MLQLFKRLQLKKENAKFLIITASAPEIVWKVAEKLNIPKDSIRVTRSERNKVPLHLSLSQFSLVFYKDNFSRKACSPTKIGELLGLGVPFICSPNIGDTSIIAKATNSGVTITDYSEDAYDKAIDEIIPLTRQDKSTIREGAFKYFNLDDGISEYSHVYNKLLN